MKQTEPAPARRSERWILAAILLTAFALRVVYVLQSRANPFFAEPTMDAGYHLDWARALNEGREFQSGPFFRAPLYPWFLALCLRLCAGSLLAVRLVQAAIGTWSCWLAWRVGARTFGSRTGLVAAGIGALYWMLIYFDGELLLPVLEVPTTLLAVLGGLRWREQPSARRALELGLALGVAAIVRPNILLFVPPLGVWMLASSVATARWRSLALAALGLALPVAPITLYNGLVGHDWTLISTQGGVNLWIGNNPQADGASAIVPGTRADWWGGYQDAIQQAEAREGRALSPSEVSASYVSRVREFWSEHPLQAAHLMAWKLRLFVTDRELGNNQDERFFALHFGPVLRWLPVGYGLLLPLALVGMLLCVRRWREWFPLYAFVPIYAASVVLFFVNARFRIPIVLPLSVFAAHALVQGAAALRARRLGALSLGVAACAALWFGVHQVPRGVKLDDAQGWWQLGVFYAQHGDDARALEHFDVALARDPSLARLHRDRGITLAHLGRSAEAESELRRALELDGGDPANYGELFSFLANTQPPRFESALEVAERAVAALPLHPTGHYDLGRALFEGLRVARAGAAPAAEDRPQLERARDEFERALALPSRGQERFNAAFALGEVQRLLGDPAAALTAWRTALTALGKPDEQGWYWRCAGSLIGLLKQEQGPEAARLEYQRLELRTGPSAELARISIDLGLH
ncbi:MAG: glycosyltransferase family 39 protein [Planctomycetes bacterium]|nr:glycosyltransferase family 39 protein [Planctomycetota bacterium]